MPAHGGMVIVGGGECGTHAAFALRDKGWGGTITVVGAEDLHAYERPPLSKATIAGGKSDPVHPYGLQEFHDARISLLRSTRVAEIRPTERRVLFEDGSRLGYTSLLLAVGSSPRRLPLPDSAGLLYLRTHHDALAVGSQLQEGRHVCVVGAGLIGLELAAAARARGCQVTVLEAGARALGRAVPAEIASEIVELHRQNGVKFRWETSLIWVDRKGGKSHATLSTGEALVFDAIVVGVGAVPDTALAATGGLTLDNGIAVDGRLSTSAAGVFAAGDCASFPHPEFGQHRIRLESWRNALDQARTAAASMLGDDEQHRAMPWFWSDQYGHSLQVVGLPSVATRTIRRIRPDGVVVHFGLDDSGSLVFASAFGPGNAVAKDIKAAEVLMRAGVEPTPQQLSDPSLPLLRLRRQALSPATPGTRGQDG